MQLIIVRHLATAHNLAGLLQGRMDLEILPPSPGDLQEIEANRREIAACGTLDGVLCSSLRRTRSTARWYGYDTEVTPEPLLDELDFGRFEGQPRARMLEAVGDAWRLDPAPLTFGEPVRVLADRIGRFTVKYRAARRLLLFAHGSWSRALLSLAEYGDLTWMNRVEIPNNRLLRIQVSSEAGAPPWDLGAMAGTAQKV